MSIESTLQKKIAAFNQDPVLNQILADILPRSPNFTYWQNKVSKWKYCYTTEEAQGGFWTLIYKPVGKGARTGKATRWTLIDKRGPYTRNVARALAKQLYLESKTQAHPQAVAA